MTAFVVDRYLNDWEDGTIVQKVLDEADADGAVDGNSAGCGSGSIRVAPRAHAETETLRKKARKTLLNILNSTRR